MLHNDGLSVVEGHLHIAGVDACELANKYGTPLYIMNEEHIRNQCRKLRNAMDKYFPDGRVMFASKAFMNKAMCRIALDEGLGLDVVSGGELFTALSVNADPKLLELHGNNKTTDEIALAIDNNIYRIIIDGFDEIVRIKKVAALKNKKHIPVSIRIRPGIEAHTFDAVQTANLDCKFGFNIASGEAMRAAVLFSNDDTFDFCGIHCHIGSQIFEEAPFKVLCKHFVDFAVDFRNKTGIAIKDFNFGGGYGVWYKNGDNPCELENYIKTIAETLNALCEEVDFPLPHVTIEPGRSIVGEAGVTLYTVGGVKEIPNIRTYVSVDGGMFDNPRCALYESEYTAVCANKADERHCKTVTVAGKCCESGDIITHGALLPESIAQDDIIAILSTGAYNYSMASNYNRNAIPPVVLVGYGKENLIVKPQRYEDIIARDVVPEHLERADLV